ncbi:hypothetical protein AB0L85_31475 [Streptomyces sp. NPDC052051]|uniref:hypothetical protein n=1 Tax=Streptomyces sp. NPDC052051 TaxID=3154649 RepID=UPI003445EB98
MPRPPRAAGNSSSSTAPWTPSSPTRTPLDALFGYGVHHQLLDRLRTLSFLRPDHTLYLDVPTETLQLRRKTAGPTAAESEYFLHEPGFLRHTRDYFVHTPRRPATGELVVLAADAGPDGVAHSVEALVTHWAR